MEPIDSITFDLDNSSMSPINDIEDMDDYFFRIRDMYGAHAILYISKSYMIETLKYCIMAVTENKPHDIYLHKLQKKFIVLGQKYP